MKIPIPNQIRRATDSLKLVWIEIEKNDGCNFKEVVPNEQIKLNAYLDFHEDEFTSIKSIKYTAETLNGHNISYDITDEMLSETNDCDVNLTEKDNEEVLPENNLLQESVVDRGHIILLNKIFNTPCYIINLPRDKEKLENTKTQLAHLGFNYINYWQAIDGKELQTFEDCAAILKEDIKSYNFKNVQELACTYSHLSILEDFLKSKDEYRIIFEDDIVVHSKFISHFNNLTNLSLDSFDILFFGGWLWSYEDAVAKISRNEYGGFKNDLKSVESHAYMINRRFAYETLKAYEESPMKVTIDLHYAYYNNNVRKCILTHSPSDSVNIKEIKNDDGKRCGLIYQSNQYKSTIQRAETELTKKLGVTL